MCSPYIVGRVSKKAINEIEGEVRHCIGRCYAYAKITFERITIRNENVSHDRYHNVPFLFLSFSSLMLETCLFVLQQNSFFFFFSTNCLHVYSNHIYSFSFGFFKKYNKYARTISKMKNSHIVTHAHNIKY